MQRIAWVTMLLVSLAALLGLFGDGPLAGASAGTTEQGLRVEYDRFLRQEAPGTLTAWVGPAAVRPDSTVEVWIDREWLSAMEVKAITPEPESTRLDGDRIIYTFRLGPLSAPVRVTWNLETHLLGRGTARVGVVGGPTYSFSQFAYP